MPIINMSNGWKVNLIRTGPKGGAPVVFLHAMGLDLTYWDQQIAGLGDAFDLIAFDFPGHGPAETIPADFSFESASRLLDAVIDHAGNGPAHLVGLSLGGQVAMAFALEHPGKVQSLSLINTACRVPSAARAKMEEKGRQARKEGMASILAGALASWFNPEFQSHRPDLMDRIAKTLLLQDPATNGGLWEQAAAFDVHGRLPSITCSTLVITGEKDVSTPEATAREIAEAIPGATLQLIPGAGHFTPIETPAVINRMLEAFIRRCQP